MPMALSESASIPPPRRFERVAIFRALQLGDLLCAVPAIRSLRRLWPGSELTLIGLPWARDLASRFSSDIDAFLEFPGFPGLPEQEPDLERLPAFFASAQRRPFDLIIQMHGSGNLVNSICALMAPRHLAGYYVPGEYCPDPARFIPYPGDRHEIVRHLLLARSLGAETDDDALEFPLYDRDFHELGRCARAHRLRAGRYVCIHAGARFPSRRWLPERFAAVGDYLAGLGFDIVLTGSADERDVVAGVAARMRTAPIDMCGQTTLGTLGALLARAALVVTNDTGTSHLAAAVRVPSVVVVLGSDEARWAPRDSRRHRRLSVAVSCRPCEHRVCPIGFPCALELPWQAVAEAAREMLDAAAPRFERHGPPVGTARGMPA